MNSTNEKGDASGVDTNRTWAVLVATHNSKASAEKPSADQRLKETKQLLSRAKALTTAVTTCVLVPFSYVREWHALAGDLPRRNMFVQLGDERHLDGVTEVMRAIRARDSRASIVLIPADHCAAIESAWVRAARGALELARYQPNTVYLLHDKSTQNERRPFDAALDFCSSTVIVGSADSMLELCAGTRSTKLIDLMTEDVASPIGNAALGDQSTGEAPINLVHVRLVEEYERIQNGSYHLAKSAGMHLLA
jgi:hypothetical protein